MEPPIQKDIADTPTGSDTQPPNPFKVGQLVDVERRMWPGINKPGGFGKVLAVSGQFVDVKYIVVGGQDKDIPIEFVKPRSLEGKRTREPSMLLGRCACGSFRKDCGHVADYQSSGESDSDSDDSVESNDTFDSIDFALAQIGVHCHNTHQKLEEARRYLKMLKDEDGEEEIDHIASGSASFPSQSQSPISRRSTRPTSKKKTKLVIADDDEDSDDDVDTNEEVPAVQRGNTATPSRTHPFDSEDEYVSNPGTPDMSATPQTQTNSPAGIEHFSSPESQASVFRQDGSPE